MEVVPGVAQARVAPRPTEALLPDHPEPLVDLHLRGNAGAT